MCSRMQILVPGAVAVMARLQDHVDGVAQRRQQRQEDIEELLARDRRGQDRHAADPPEHRGRHRREIPDAAQPAHASAGRMASVNTKITIAIHPEMGGQLLGTHVLHLVRKGGGDVLRVVACAGRMFVCLNYRMRFRREPIPAAILSASSAQTALALCRRLAAKPVSRPRSRPTAVMMSRERPERAIPRRERMKSNDAGRCSFWASARRWCRPAPAARSLRENWCEEIWEIAQIEGAKVGFLHTTVRRIESESGKRLRAAAELDLTFKRHNALLRLRRQHGTEETLDGKVVGVFMRQGQEGGRQLVLSGQLEDGRMHVRIDKGRIDRRLRWSDDVVGLYRLEQLFQQRKPKPDDRWTLRRYDPTYNTVVTLRVAVKEREEVALSAGAGA